MELNQIKKIAEQILTNITPYISKGMICGSIKREKQNPRDIDIVIVPKDNFISMMEIRKVLAKEGKFVLNGNQLIRVVRKDGLQIDMNIANREDYEVAVLLKTGSKEHNIKLCSEAKKKGGVMRAEGLILNNLIINKEREILERVFGRWIEPKDRG